MKVNDDKVYLEGRELCIFLIFVIMLGYYLYKSDDRKIGTSAEISG